MLYKKKNKLVKYYALYRWLIQTPKKEEKE